MVNIPFSPQKYDYIIIPGIIYRTTKQVILDFLVDTGASTTMVDPRIMENLGYTPHCSEFLGHALVSSPAGTEEGYRIRTQKLLVYSSECAVTNIDIVCIRPERNVEALLGLNFLKHFKYSVDHKKCVLTLEKN